MTQIVEEMPTLLQVTDKLVQRAIDLQLPLVSIDTLLRDGVAPAEIKTDAPPPPGTIERLMWVSDMLGALYGVAKDIQGRVG